MIWFFFAFLKFGFFSYFVYEADYYQTKFQFYEMYQKDILERIRMPVDRNRQATLLISKTFNINNHFQSLYSSQMGGRCCAGERLLLTQHQRNQLVFWEI
jgi:hypothetical protein